MTRSVRRAAVALALMGAAGLPATYFVADWLMGSGDGSDNVISPTLAATAAGGWVWFIAIMGLAPLWLARRASPAQQVNARLGHVLVRLLLTAGGLMGLLLWLPENNRLAVGLFGLGWYVLTWVVDFGLLQTNAAQSGL
ncbi:MAG: hypothetical protein AAGL98_09070 [Planctomycetota bacterium]